MKARSDPSTWCFFLSLAPSSPSTCCWWPFICSLVLNIGSFFSSSYFLEWILSIFIDYYILENNSLLKAALKYKRIQLTDFRTVPTEHFGEKKESLSICTLSAENLWQLCNIKHFSPHKDLPLKLSYPPDFSDSRHYGLLLLVYVSHVFWVFFKF